MPTKAEIIEQLSKYDNVDKGWGRRNLYGDNDQVKYLRGVLQLPHIKALSNEALISLRTELQRLDIDFDRVYSSTFLNVNSGHASSKLFDYIISRDLDLSTCGFIPIGEAISTSKKIENTLELLRDKLIFYIACASSQPILALFAADCLVPGSSGFGGLKRANDFLKIVQLALEQYKESGVLSPLFSVRYDMVFGAHTRTLIEPTLSILMGAIKDHFGIASKFINTFSANGEGASISESRTQCRILIAGREIINKTIECYCTDDLFMVFLEKHLIKNNYSFTKPSLNPFSESAFIKEFGKYVIERERCERVSRARIAEEERGRIKDVPMY